MSGLNAKAYTVLTMLAIFAMAALAAYQFAWPKPRSPYTPAQWAQRLAEINSNITTEQKQLGDATAYVSRYVWNVKLDSVTGHALDSVTVSAHAHHVQLVGFRPQKTGTVQGLVTVPYLVLLNGSFENVTATLKDLEQPTNKLAVQMVQYAAADESTDAVNATLTLVAYQNPPSQEASDAATAKK